LVIYVQGVVVAKRGVVVAKRGVVVAKKEVVVGVFDGQLPKNYKLFNQI
jgi:hypothetical protein